MAAFSAGAVLAAHGPKPIKSAPRALVLRRIVGVPTVPLSG